MVIILGMAASAVFLLNVYRYVNKWIKMNADPVSEKHDLKCCNLFRRMNDRDLSIIIPAFNESKRLPSTLMSLLTVLNERKHMACEIIIVDDGSTDQTIPTAMSTFKQFCNDEPFTRTILTTIKLDKNSGKGNAVTQVYLPSQLIQLGRVGE